MDKEEYIHLLCEASVNDTTKFEKIDSEYHQVLSSTTHF